MNTNLIIGIGLVAGIAWYASRQRKRNAPVYVSNTIAGNYNARTIPPLGIFVKSDQQENKELLAHEARHWEQFQKMGLVQYYFTYAREMHEYGYDKMPMETAVRGNESEYCQQNYTECVRAGTAKTVHNPNFRS